MAFFAEYKNIGLSRVLKYLVLIVKRKLRQMIWLVILK